MNSQVCAVMIAFALAVMTCTAQGDIKVRAGASSASEESQFENVTYSLIGGALTIPASAMNSVRPKIRVFSDTGAENIPRIVLTGR